MRLLVVCILFGISFATVAASVTETVKPVTPYAPIPFDAVGTTERMYLGALIGDPHLYEFTIGNEVTTTTIELLQHREATVPYSLLLVRVNDNERGVKEVLRVDGREQVWHDQFSARFGMTFRTTDPITFAVGRGTYRLEVSTPDNDGSYALRVDGGQSSSYGSVVASVHAVQAHFGYPLVAILLTPYVYVPVALLVFVGIYGVWRWRRSLTHSSV